MKQNPEYYRKKFIERVENHECVVGIIGLGYVGLPLMLGLCERGLPVIGFDNDPQKVEMLANGHSYISHIDNSKIEKMMAGGRARATVDFSTIKECDAILICVPTPLTKQREPDVSFIVSTAKTIAPHLRSGQLIVLESTTYPGTTREILQPLLEEENTQALKANKDFFVAYSPEREDPGNAHFATTSIPKVVGATTNEAREMACMLYGLLVPQVVPVSSADTAEAVKITENIYRAVNVALINELKVIYDRMGIDIWEVVEAAKTKPFGYTAFYPGPGLGGHCIPIDPFYLTWKAREFKLNTRFIELAGEINHGMPQYVVSKLERALSREQQRALDGARILIVGMAYKKNVNDIRESPSFELMEILKQCGVELDYYDPYVPEIPKTREHVLFAGMKSIDWAPKVLQKFDAIVISTDHDSIDWQLLCDNASLIVDTRNALKDIDKSTICKIVKA